MSLHLPLPSAPLPDTRPQRPRTSLTDPLRIDALTAGAGQIGICLCPGKQGSSLSGPAWRRDLALDLEVILRWQPGAVVTLIEAEEFEALGVGRLGPLLQRQGQEWHHLPITDMQAPDRRFEQRWQDSGPRLKGHLAAGRRVLVHCRGGLGRAGTVAARLLVELGLEPGAAMARVRRARPGAIESIEQVRYLLDGASLWRR